MSESLEERFGELKGLMQGLTKSIEDHMDREELDRKAIVSSLELLHDGQAKNSKRLDKVETKFGLVCTILKWAFRVTAGVGTTVLGAYLIKIVVGG
jgi:hypothetical protein